MKTLFLAFVVMSAMAMAQTSSDATTTKTKTKHAKHEAAATSDTAAAGEKTITGCLQKDGDNMWLHSGMSKMGMGSKYHVMSNEDLSAHDGHKVKITGKVSKGPLGNDKNVKHLEASKVEMVSDKCSWTNGSKKEEKATTTKK
jgi:hypothetical protein